MTTLAGTASPEEKISLKALDSLENTANPRLKALLTGLVTHLHSLIKETGLTEEEWVQAIQFLTRTGQKCDAKRQEFILLSDILGVSMLVDALFGQTAVSKKSPAISRGFCF